MKKLFVFSSIAVFLFLVSLLTSCSEGGKSYSGPLGKEATVAAKSITEIHNMNEKMKDLTKSADNLKDAVELQKKLNEYLENADKELQDFKTQYPNGKPVPFDQKNAKDVYEITAVNFTGYNINAHKDDVQSHFQAKVKVLMSGVPDGVNIDFVDAAGNILLKEKFYLGSGISEKPEPNKVITMYCNSNEFSKILDLTKINVQ
jgi:exonuclease VII small subunit